MARYEIAVTEHRAFDRVYVVEAESEGEAQLKAENGETIEELDWADNYYYAVVQRTCDKITKIEGCDACVHYAHAGRECGEDGGDNGDHCGCGGPHDDEPPAWKQQAEEKVGW